MLYGKTTKILCKQIEILTELAKKNHQVAPNYAIFLKLCVRILETSKLFPYSLTYSRVGINNKELKKAMASIDNLVYLIDKDFEEPETCFCIEENQALCYVLQASTNIKRLLTIASNSRIRYDGEDL